MASIGFFRRPVRAGVGGCLPAGPWFGTTPCPKYLQIELSTFAPSPVLAVNFAGRGKCDPWASLCGFADSYVTAVSATVLRIAVWDAYRASVWTSSTTVLIYGGAATADPVAGVSAKKGGSSTGAVSGTYAWPAGGGCPATLLATVTVTDIGGLTIVP